MVIGFINAHITMISAGHWRRQFSVTTADAASAVTDPTAAVTTADGYVI